MPILKNLAYSVVAITLGATGTFVLVEGGLSLFLFVNDFIELPSVAERLHTRYDEEIGWVALPNIRIDNMYGPGVYLETNDEGFRNSENFGTQVPSGRFRVVCSGDSFTLGFGVSNTDSWCSQLETLEERFQMANLGQGGYGVDQAYLQYLRNGTLRHDLHIFAFITSDFSRMERASFLGYGKPRMAVHQGVLKVMNFPVPRTPSRSIGIRRVTSSLRTVEFGDRLRAHLRGTTSQKHPAPRTDTIEVVMRIFEELATVGKERGAKLVAVHLPTLRDHPSPAADTAGWAYRLEAISRRYQVPYFDLTQKVRDLSAEEFDSLFLPAEAVRYYGAGRHYNAKGNSRVATWLFEKLRETPNLLEGLEVAE